MKTLIVITGPTASGKSSLALGLAKKLRTSIISADSRQIFRGIPIGTAAPSQEEMAAVPHFFVGTLELTDYYSASEFENDALRIISEEFKEKDYVVMCGGSMMYVDAVVKGLDDLPTISEEIRGKISARYNEEGLESLLNDLRELDPEYYETVDKSNYKRVVHALEIITQSGRKYSELRTNTIKQRNFRIKEYALDLPREILFDRINSRTERMMAEGWEEETRSILPLRHLNSLNTVGYKELFAMFDGTMSREEAIEKIKRNTRVYAKKQLTWLKKRPDTTMLDGTLPVQRLIDFVIADCSL